MSTRRCRINCLAFAIAAAGALSLGATRGFAGTGTAYTCPNDGVVWLGTCATTEACDATCEAVTGSATSEGYCQEPGGPYGNCCLCIAGAGRR